MILVAVVLATAASSHAQSGYTWHVNPANGRAYALTAPMSWQSAEAEAILLGGHLATVRSQAEQSWIWSTFGGGVSLWIGFSDAAVEGQWGWSSGEAVTYIDWHQGEPNNNGDEDFAAMATGPGGKWNDVASWVATFRGVVERGAAPAGVTVFGGGCGSPALALVPSSMPVLGSPSNAVITNAPTLAAGVSMGWSDSLVAGLPILPIDLGPFGMTGCTLWHSNDLPGLVATPLTATTLQFSYAIPLAPSLAGADVFLQSYCYAPGANPLEIVVSNGVRWTLGF